MLPKINSLYTFHLYSTLPKTHLVQECTAYTYLPVSMGLSSGSLLRFLKYLLTSYLLILLSGIDLIFVFVFLQIQEHCFNFHWLQCKFDWWAFFYMSFSHAVPTQMAWFNLFFCHFLFWKFTQTWGVNKFFSWPKVIHINTILSRAKKMAITITTKQLRTVFTMCICSTVLAF